VKKPLVPFG